MADETEANDTKTERGEVDSERLVEQAAELVSAYVRHNTLGSSEVGNLLTEVHRTLVGLNEPQPVEPVQEPAVPIRKSIQPDHIVCLECGKKFQSLRRHLNSQHDLTPDAYRAKWNLSSGYPMVAAAYAAKRSRVARQIGLGRRDRSAQSA